MDPRRAVHVIVGSDVRVNGPSLLLEGSCLGSTPNFFVAEKPSMFDTRWINVHARFGVVLCSWVRHVELFDYG